MHEFESGIAWIAQEQIVSALRDARKRLGDSATWHLLLSHIGIEERCAFDLIEGKKKSAFQHKPGLEEKLNRQP